MSIPRTTRLAAILLTTILMSADKPSLAGAPDLLPEHPAVPEGLGVNIHFTDPRPGEMELLAEAGFRWIRMDFAWGGTERQKGQYDLDAYDRLLTALEPHGIRALFILDYSNRHYDGGLSPCSDEGRAAFARWAAAAVQRFRGRGILWEMYNEPNIGFWKPKPDAEQYVKLALAVGQAIRRVAADELYVGPATSQVDLKFLEKCFQAGLLEYWSAVSVHPYRQQPPETAAEDYARLRRLIARYAPPGKRIPILSGEWGYSAAWQRMDAEKQGQMLPRQWLTNLANDVPVSIWYDWHDDGPDPKEPEHHFGTVLFPYRQGQRPVYEPKPAYRAAQTLTKTLAGFRFNKRLCLGNDEDYVLLFTRQDDVRLAVWTMAKAPHAVTIPASAGRFTALGHTGETLPPVTAQDRALTITLTDAPQYLTPSAPNDGLRLAAAWQRAPLDVVVEGGQPAACTLAFRNPLAKAIRVGTSEGGATLLQPGGNAALTYSPHVLRDAELQAAPLTCYVEGLGKLTQTTLVSASHPLRAEVLPATNQWLAVRLENPSGQAFCGNVQLMDLSGLSAQQLELPVCLEKGHTERVVQFPVRGEIRAPWRLGVRVTDPGGELQLELPPATFRAVDDFARWTGESVGAAYQILPDGDAKVNSTQTAEFAQPPEGPPLPGAAAIRIRYHFDAGWKFVRLAPRERAVRAIEGQPQAFRAWVYGDGSGNWLRLRVTDATGQTFQPGGQRLDWRGWRCVTIPLDAGHAGHWGGADDGVMHDPIRWDTLVLIDSAVREETAGEVYLASPVLVYGG
ncbi:MAG: cellulase family glycosylhydrolase [Candidatus Anammoximicrobium sp.]|nr:cellulase family glycosylhydrolase [Candidatus Anammoximicrobium sp.]